MLIIVQDGPSGHDDGAETAAPAAGSSGASRSSSGTALSEASQQEVEVHTSTCMLHQKVEEVALSGVPCIFRLHLHLQWQIQH